MAIIELVDEKALRDYVGQFDRKWKGVTLHHSWRPTAAEYKGKETIKAIRKYHMQTNGRRDVGYHFLVGPDGRIFAGRPLDMDGAHALTSIPGCLAGTGLTSPNKETIGICAIGDYDAELSSPDLMGALRNLKVALEAHYGELAEYQHRKFQAKTCPGRNLWDFRWEPEVEMDFDAVSPWAAEAWQKFTAAGIVDGKDAKLWMTREMAAVMIDRALTYYSQGEGD